MSGGRRTSAPVGRLLALSLLLGACAADPSTAPSTTTTSSTTTSTTTTTTTVPTPRTTTTMAATDVASTVAEAPTTTVDPTDAAFGWEVSADDDLVEYGFLEVPLDHGEPEGETIELAVARHRSPDPSLRIGVLLVNPGGPGIPGLDFARDARQIFGFDVVDAFDVVSWDVRGVGASFPSIDCVEEVEHYFAIEMSPDDPEEEERLRDTAATFARGCEDRTGPLLAHIATVDSARDMDLIRRALGETQVSFYGGSYGSQLGATWASLFPDTVRAAVLDGAVDPELDLTGSLLARAAAFERALADYLAGCPSRPTCELDVDGDAESAYAAIVAEIEQDPPDTAFGRPDLFDGLFEGLVSGLLRDDRSWRQLDTILEEIRAGFTSSIAFEEAEDVPLADDNLVDSVIAITCADSSSSEPRARVIERAASTRAYFTAVSRLGLVHAFELLLCASFGTREPEQVELGAEGAGPIMVIGTRGDTATPYEGSVAMADALETAFLLSVEGHRHTAYAINFCATAAVDTFLVELEQPSDSTCGA